MTRISKFLAASAFAIAAGGFAAAPVLAADAATAPTTKVETGRAPAAQAPAAPQTPPASAANVAASKAPAPKMHKVAAMSRKRVEHIQAALARSGENVAIDGIWGPKTSAAIKDFQKNHGLMATGHLNHKTLEALPKV